MREARQVGPNCELDAVIKPYLVLDHMIEAAFEARPLFGVTFAARKRCPVWPPESGLGGPGSRRPPKGLFYGDTAQALQKLAL